MTAPHTFDLLTALRGTPTFFKMNREARADQEAARSALARDLAAVTAAAEIEDPKLQRAFDEALAAREKTQQDFAAAAVRVNVAQADRTTAHAHTKNATERLRRQLTDLADPSIAPALRRVDELIDQQRQQNVRGDDPHYLACLAARIEIEALLTTADIDAAARVSVLLSLLAKA